MKTDIEEIAISKFKATCLAVLERVRTTGKPVRITRFGKPVAEVVPSTPGKPKRRLLGCMAGTLEFVGHDPNEPGLDPGWQEHWLTKWDERERAGAQVEARNLAAGRAEPRAKRRSRRPNRD